MAYTAEYAAADISEVIIDAIVSLASGMVTGGNLYLAGGAIAITVGVMLYLGLFGRFLSWLKGFVNATKKF